MITFRIHNTFELSIFNTKSFGATQGRLIVNSSSKENPEDADLGIFENTIKLFHLRNFNFNNTLTSTDATIQ